MARIDVAEAERILDRAQAAQADGSGIEGTGFWRAVALLRTRRAVAERLAAKAAAIDIREFDEKVKLKLPIGPGITLLALLSFFGGMALPLSRALEGWWRDLFFLGGFGALEIGTHTLTHWFIGRAMGIRFTHVFIGGPPPPRPGAKIDYASYLLVPPRHRAMMHASGAIITKVLPFGLIPVANWAGVSGWMIWLLVVVGVGQVVTDVLFSTKTSDWKRAKREWAAGSGGWS